MISFTCDNCRKKFRVSNDKGGKTARCPGCGQVLHIPLPDGAPHQPLGVQPTAGAPAQTPHRRYYPHHRHAGGQARSSQAGRQRANMILLGVVLLIGFLMPVIQIDDIGQPHGKFINITIMSAEWAPMQLKVLFLTPGVAGIGLLILQAYTRHPVRGIVVIFLAAMPTLIALANPEAIEGLGALQKHIPTEAAFLMLVCFLGLFVAPVAMLVGIRSRGYRPDSPAAYWFGLGGAGAWFIFLAAPALPAELGHIFLMLPIKMIGQEGAGGISMGLLILMACTTISAVLCITNKLIPDIRLVRSRAGLAFWTLTIGFVVFMLCISGQFITNFPSFMRTMKFLCWFLGWFLLLPAGITDLVVGRDRHHEHQTPAVPHPHTTPDIPRRVV